MILTLFFCALNFLDLINAQKWPDRAYLATYPRSGNHWMRHLVEEASHIATSSVYRDGDHFHLTKIFPWGGYCCEKGYAGDCRYPSKHEMVFIKTHFPAQEKHKFDGLSYRSSVRIVRHPIDSIYSYYIYNEKNPEEIIPRKFVEEYVQSWRSFQEHWNKLNSIVTIRYEDLLVDPTPHLKKVLEILKYEFTEDDVARAIKKHPSQGKMLKHLHHFSKEDAAYVYTELKDLMNQFGYFE